MSSIVRASAGVCLTGAFLGWSSDFVGGWMSVWCRRPHGSSRSLAGEVVVVTGGNAGIGLGIVAALAQKGATVVMCCRSVQKGQAAVAALPNHYKIDIMELELGSVKSIQDFVKRFREQYSKLNVLILNGGQAKTFTGSGGYSCTADGFESMIGVNFLGHFYLTVLLLPLLRSTPHARVIAQSSLASANSYPRGIDTRTWRARAPCFKDWMQYGQSKLALLLFIRQLQTREPSLLCLACHPGVVDGTSLMQADGILEWLYSMFVFRCLAMSQRDGARNTIYLASTADSLQPGGFYFPTGRLTSWPWCWLSHAFQRAASLQLPLRMETDHPKLWEDAEAALLDAGATGL